MFQPASKAFASIESKGHAQAKDGQLADTKSDYSTVAQEFRLTKALTGFSSKEQMSRQDTWQEDIKRESSIEFQDRYWERSYDKIDMFAVKLNQEGGFNFKSFNKVSDIALLPSRRVMDMAFKKYQQI